MLFRRPPAATALVRVNHALRQRLQLRETTLKRLTEQLSQLQAELDEGTALTTCPDCGSASATSTQALSNRRLGELERQNRSLQGKLLEVEGAIEALWLYPVEEFPSGNAAADITLFATHMKLFTDQVQAKMASLAASLARLTAAAKPD